MDEIEVLRELTVGRITLKVFTIYDEFSADGLEFLGHAIERIQNARPDEFVYDRREGVMRLPGKYGGEPGAWRDEHGQIVAQPDEPGWINEAPFFAIPSESCDGQLKYAFQNADRMRRYYNDDWYFLGVLATVTETVADSFGNEVKSEVASDALWGIESDSDPTFIRDEARQVAIRALADAKSSRKIPA